MILHHWSVDTKKMRKHPSFPQWQLEQRINFGLGQKKISRRALIKYWDVLDIDPDRRRYLSFLLWKKAS